VFSIGPGYPQKWENVQEILFLASGRWYDNTDVIIDIISESIQEETDETDLFIYEISDFVSRDGFFGFFHRGLGCRTR
jgi:hypothetical protein